MPPTMKPPTMSPMLPITTASTTRIDVAKYLQKQRRAKACFIHTSTLGVGLGSAAASVTAICRYNPITMRINSVHSATWSPRTGSVFDTKETNRAITSRGRNGGFQRDEKPDPIADLASIRGVVGCSMSVILEPHLCSNAVASRANEVRDIAWLHVSFRRVSRAFARATGFEQRTWTLDHHAGYSTRAGSSFRRA